LMPLAKEREAVYDFQMDGSFCPWWRPEADRWKPVLKHWFRERYQHQYGKRDPGIGFD
jgi:hypothetical protein